MKELIKKLVESYGPSGNERQTRDLIAAEVKAYVDEMRVDQMGNLIALKRGNGSGKRIMVAAHMDEIGLIVTHIDKNGFVRFGTVGGVRAHTLVGGRAVFENGTVGVIGWEKWLMSTGMASMDELFIDVGATSPDDCPVGIGDMAGFKRPMDDLGNRLVAKSMDDRIACAVAIQALQQMGDSPNDIYFVFTVQEEVGTRGAMVSAFGISPDVGIAVDVCPVGDTPEAHPMAVGLGKGAAIKVMDSGAITHPGVKQWMITTAEANDITHQLEVLEFGGTDARAIQQTKAGIPAGCISIPCRYVHTPSEMVDMSDVQACVALLTKLVEGEVTI